MHPFSSLTIGIFVAGYITARWDLVTRLYELSIFAWDHGVIVRVNKSVVDARLTATQTRATKAFAVISLIFVLIAIPLDRIAAHESVVVSLPCMHTRSWLSFQSIQGLRYTVYPPESNSDGEDLSRPAETC
jgi:hypothetical protein